MMNPKLFALSLLALVLTGCTTFQDAAKTDATAEDTYKSVSETKKSITNTRHIQTETVRYVERQWVSLKPSMLKPEPKFPPFRCRMVVNTSVPVTLLEISQLITKECKIAVRVTPDALQSRFTNSNQPGGLSGQMPQMAQPMQYGQGGQSNSQNKTDTIDINYDGELDGFLDMTAAGFGLQWKREDASKVMIYNVDTETFSLHAIASGTEMFSNLEAGTSMVNGVSGSNSGSNAAGSSGGVGGGSGSSQKTTVSMKTDIWADIKTTLNSMKSARGAVETSPATGMVVITDTNEAMSRMRKYLNEVNVRLTKQVTFNVQLLAVTIKDSNRLTLSWDLVYRSLAGKYGMALKSGATPISGGNSGSFAILGADNRWSGSEAIVSALAEQGSVRIMRSPSASTLNLSPVSLQIARQEGFLAGSSITQTPTVGTQTALQTGQITYGFNMSFFPYVMDDDQMILQFSVNLSNIDGRRTVTSGNASAEVFDIAMPINSTQKTKLRAGETIVVAGFDQEDEIGSRQGTDTAKNMFFGGGVRSDKSRSTLVMLITPNISE